jgi:hypothetical protein
MEDEEVEVMERQIPVVPPTAALQEQLKKIFDQQKLRSKNDGLS